MSDFRTEIRFLLNEQTILLSELRASDTLLDFLRQHRRMTGTKEGCAEGDCGACSVLVGRIMADGELAYETVNACIRLVGSLDGCHVVTVEHLRGREEGRLHPVQQAMVDEHGSQCGFCTPGIVMSLYALWLRNEHPDESAAELALQGNLCRCTGYAPILRAAKAIPAHGRVADDPLVTGRDQVLSQLQSLQDGRRVVCGPEGERVLVPADVDDLAEILLTYPEATLIAGSTDVGLWVTKFMRRITPAVFIGNLIELQQIEVQADRIVLGSGVSYSQGLVTLARYLPQLRPYIERIGGEQVRNMGTIGGNIANGSPIGDMPPALIALDARIVLRQGVVRRSLRLEDFFIDYGKQDRKPGEFVERIEIPLPQEGDRYAVYKISKRRDEDISAVAAGIWLRLDDAGRISGARIAFGGMAATPKRALAAERALIGTAFAEEDIAAAMDALATDFQPLSDWRASAKYRMLVAQNLLRRFWLEQQGGAVTLRRERVA